jgi:hypothetical protein
VGKPDLYNLFHVGLGGVGGAINQGETWFYICRIKLVNSREWRRSVALGSVTLILLVMEISKANMAVSIRKPCTSNLYSGVSSRFIEVNYDQDVAELLKLMTTSLRIHYSSSP